MKSKQSVLLIVISIICLFSGCMMGNIIGQTNKIRILEKTAKPEKNKSVAIMIQDFTTRGLSTLQEAEYLEDQKRYFSEAFRKIGITNYDFLKTEGTNNLNKDYVMTITVEEWSARKRQADSITTRIDASLVVTIVNKTTNSLIAKIAGEAGNDQWGYNINKFISNLLKEMLRKLYE